MAEKQTINQTLNAKKEEELIKKKRIEHIYTKILLGT